MFTVHDGEELMGSYEISVYRPEVPDDEAERDRAPSAIVDACNEPNSMFRMTFPGTRINSSAPTAPLMETFPGALIGRHLEDDTHLMITGLRSSGTDILTLTGCASPGTRSNDVGRAATQDAADDGPGGEKTIRRSEDCRNSVTKASTCSGCEPVSETSSSRTG
jgi:hypothetical protein